MKSTLSFAAAVLIATFAGLPSSQAAGYSCLSVDRDSRITIYVDQLDSAQLGTPVARKMVFIDPSVSPTKQIIATFHSRDGLLKSEGVEDGQRFTARVNTGFPESSRAGRKIGGTVLGSLDEISVELQTVTACHPAPLFTEGSIYAAQATYLKKNGQELKQDLDCLLFIGSEAPETQWQN